LGGPFALELRVPAARSGLRPEHTGPRSVRGKRRNLFPQHRRIPGMVAMVPLGKAASASTRLGAEVEEIFPEEPPLSTEGDARGRVLARYESGDPPPTPNPISRCYRLGLRQSRWGPQDARSLTSAE